MAEDGAGSARERCGEPSRLRGQAGVAHGIDAAVDAVQASAGHAMGSAAGPEPDHSELAEGDDAVLSLRQPRKPYVEARWFGRRTVRVRDPDHRPNVGGRL
jgi:hypothetical protein